MCCPAPHFFCRSQVLATTTVPADEANAADWRVMVHYEGWNKKWDEWIGPDRVLELNEANLVLQAETVKAAKQKASAARTKSQQGGAKHAGSTKARDSLRGVKRKIDAAHDTVR